MTTSPDTIAPDEAGLTTVALLTLGCARNEVDSEELAGRLEAGGFRLVEDPAAAIHSPDESVDPREIERIALAEAAFLQRYR